MKNIFFLVIFLSLFSCKDNSTDTNTTNPFEGRWQVTSKYKPYMTDTILTLTDTSLILVTGNVLEWQIISENHSPYVRDYIGTFFDDQKTFTGMQMPESSNTNKIHLYKTDSDRFEGQIDNYYPWSALSYKDIKAIRIK
jgi:hypothetical protein